MGEIFDALRRTDLFDDELKPRHEVAPPAAEAGAPALPFAGLAPEGPEAPEVPEENGPSVELSTELQADWVARTVLAAPTSAGASRYRHAALRVRHALKRAGGALFAVTSASAGEGKTTSACNLALALASMSSGGSVALVDLDLRNPRMARALGIDFEVGFEQVLSGEVELRDARLRTQLETLDLFPSRCWGRDAHELLADARAAEVLADLGARYDAVVLDCPPVLPVPDTRLITEHVTACMLVVRAGQTRTRAIEETLRYLEHAPVEGFFVNCLELHGGASSYYYAYGEEKAP